MLEAFYKVPPKRSKYLMFKTEETFRILFYDWENLLVAEDGFEPPTQGL